MSGLSKPAEPIERSEPTGVPAVDAALRAVAGMSRGALSEQLARYEAAHRVLRETLAQIDED